MSETQALQKRFGAALMPNYGMPPVAISRGQGCRVWDADGREYLDLIAGIAVSSLGHAHPAVVEAVTRQVAVVAHTSNLFLHEREIELAERLLCLLGGNDPPRLCLLGGTTPPDPPATGGYPPPVPPGPPLTGGLPVLLPVRTGGCSSRTREPRPTRRRSSWYDAARGRVGR